MVNAMDPFCIQFTRTYGAWIPPPPSAGVPPMKPVTPTRSFRVLVEHGATTFEKKESPFGPAWLPVDEEDTELTGRIVAGAFHGMLRAIQTGCTHWVRDADGPPTIDLGAVGDSDTSFCIQFTRQYDESARSFRVLVDHVAAAFEKQEAPFGPLWLAVHKKHSELAGRIAALAFKGMMRMEHRPAFRRMMMEWAASGVLAVSGKVPTVDLGPIDGDANPDLKPDGDAKPVPASAAETPVHTDIDHQIAQVHLEHQAHLERRIAELDQQVRANNAADLVRAEREEFESARVRKYVDMLEEQLQNNTDECVRLRARVHELESRLTDEAKPKSPLTDESVAAVFDPPADCLCFTSWRARTWTLRGPRPHMRTCPAAGGHGWLYEPLLIDIGVARGLARAAAFLSIDSRYRDRDGKIWDDQCRDALAAAVEIPDLRDAATHIERAVTRDRRAIPLTDAEVAMIATDGAWNVGDVWRSAVSLAVEVQRWRASTAALWVTVNEAARSRCLELVEAVLAAAPVRRSIRAQAAARAIADEVIRGAAMPVDSPANHRAAKLARRHWDDPMTDAEVARIATDGGEYVEVSLAREVQRRRAVTAALWATVNKAARSRCLELVEAERLTGESAKTIRAQAAAHAIADEVIRAASQAVASGNAKD